MNLFFHRIGSSSRDGLDSSERLIHREDLQGTERAEEGTEETLGISGDEHWGDPGRQETGRESTQISNSIKKISSSFHLHQSNKLFV